MPKKLLHEDEKLFKDFIDRTAEEMGLPPQIIEKDYYVTLVLEKIVEKNPRIMFKGGTSLSKCFNAIDRFSEDIDLTMTGDKPTQGQRKSIKYDIVDVVAELGLSINNIDDIKSNREFNRYEITYPSLYPNIKTLKSYIYVETAVFLRAYPYVTAEADSYIGKYIKQKGLSGHLEEFDLHTFDVNTQSIERTIIDKCFAICDYYLIDNTRAQSRHIYDIYKLLPYTALDQRFRELVVQVKKDREQDEECVSAKDVDVENILNRIVTENIFRNDYENNTMDLFFKNEHTTYETAITGITEIVKSGMFKGLGTKTPHPKAKSPEKPDTEQLEGKE